ncbi:MAG: hypothetical protein GY941_22305 [Planctomycetes bacterium]|nr:hypothetical protein [Planctomycetota bacterium]
MTTNKMSYDIIYYLKGLLTGVGCEDTTDIVQTLENLWCDKCDLESRNKKLFDEVKKLKGNEIDN